MSGNNTTRGTYIIRAFHQDPHSQARSIRNHNCPDLRSATAQMDKLARANDRTLFRLELTVVLMEWWKKDSQD